MNSRSCNHCNPSLSRESVRCIDDDEKIIEPRAKPEDAFFPRAEPEIADRARGPANS